MWAIRFTTRSVIQNGFLRTGVCYTTDEKARILALFNMMQANGRNGDDRNNPLYEGGPNWELFNPRGNRFILPNSVGLAWHTPKTIENNMSLSDYIDFHKERTDKFQISIQPCPSLIKNRFKNNFTRPQTIITLYYQKDTELEYSARNFVLAATEICRRLNFDGHICDFFNPFSGKPFYGMDGVANTEGYPFKCKKSDGCTMVTSDLGKKFHGIIFTNAKYDKFAIWYALQTDLPMKRLLMRSKLNDDDDDDDYEDDY